MPSVASTDIARMRDRLFFDGPHAGRKQSAFWTLLLLAAAIASAGVVADSTATVIGAMIVAPLMTPILGIVLAVTVADGRNLALSLLLVLAGSVAVVGVGFAFGMLVPFPVDAQASTQVAGRVEPRLVDLIGALATGAVGAFALVREDVSDTLPGVAIAIALVPPLAVVGLTLEARAVDEALGALLLFATNVAAILVMGLLVMGLYRVRRTEDAVAAPRHLGHRAATAVVVVFVVAVMAVLGASSSAIVNDRLRTASVDDVARRWAERAGWDVVRVESRQDGFLVRAIGALPTPDPRLLRAQLNTAGLEDADIRLELVPELRLDLTADG